MKNYEAIVIGASAGGTKALNTILTELPKAFPLPIIIVIHRYYDEGSLLISQFRRDCQMEVRETADKEKITNGCIYFAPADYHVLIEENKTFSLSHDPEVNFARPSIDVLFDSAAYVYGNSLIGIICTGANSDGSNGLMHIKERGGLSIVQDPETAESKAMPKSALDTSEPNYIFDLMGIKSFLVNLIAPKG